MMNSIRLFLISMIFSFHLQAAERCESVFHTPKDTDKLIELYALIQANPSELIMAKLQTDFETELLSLAQKRNQEPARILQELTEFKDIAHDLEAQKQKDKDLLQSMENAEAKRIKPIRAEKIQNFEVPKLSARLTKNFLVTSKDGNLKITDVIDGKIIAELGKYDSANVKIISNNGRFVLIRDEDKNMHLFDTKKQSYIVRNLKDEFLFEEAQFFEHWLFYRNLNLDAVFINLQSGKVERFSDVKSVRKVGRRLVVQMAELMEIRILEEHNLSRKKSFHTNSQITKIDTHEPSQSVFVHETRGKLNIYDAQNLKQLEQLEVLNDYNNQWGVIASPDNRHVLLPNGYDTYIHYDTKENRVLEPLKGQAGTFVARYLNETTVARFFTDIVVIYQLVNGKWVEKATEHFSYHRYELFLDANVIIGNKNVGVIELAYLEDRTVFDKITLPTPLNKPTEWTVAKNQSVLIAYDSALEIFTVYKLHKD